MKDDDDYIYDDENPEWTEDRIKNAKRMIDVMPEVVEAFKRGDYKQVGRPKSENPKKHIGIRLDADIVEWLRAQKGYNGLINDILRTKMEDAKA